MLSVGSEEVGHHGGGGGIGLERPVKFDFDIPHMGMVVAEVSLDT